MQLKYLRTYALICSWKNSLFVDLKFFFKNEHKWNINENDDLSKKMILSN